MLEATATTQQLATTPIYATNIHIFRTKMDGGASRTVMRVKIYSWGISGTKCIIHHGIESLLGSWIMGSRNNHATTTTAAAAQQQEDGKQRRSTKKPKVSKKTVTIYLKGLKVFFSPDTSHEQEPETEHTDPFDIIDQKLLISALKNDHG